MAKKKVNVRKDYDLEARDMVVYKRSRIPRQMQFMILRGPGLDVQAAIEENEEMKKLSLRKRFKLKFMQARNVDEVILHLKDANTWATGVIYNLGDLKDESQLIKKTIDRILITSLEVKETGKINSILEALQTLAA